MMEKSAQIGRKRLMAKNLDSKYLRVNHLRHEFCISRGESPEDAAP
jgi:hypothetical protein